MAHDQAAEKEPVTATLVEPAAADVDEGGLRAPPELRGWRKFWWWFDFLILVKLARLRFVAVLVLIGVVITQWDTLAAYYDRWTRSDDGQAASDVEYFCPMHPTVVRDTNKEKCPVCFMPLSRRKKGEVHEEALPAGVVNRVQLSPYRVALAGAETWKVDYVPLAKEITAVGTIEFNERAQRQVAARIAGRIDRLDASETGRMVAEGDVLAAIYSPELQVTVENLLRARNDPESFKAQRRRLELWGIDDDQIDAILKSGKPPTHLEIRSPIAGHVIRKYVREGQYVEVGAPLYDVADLSTVWIYAQIYEDDLAFLPPQLVHPSGNGTAEPMPVTATTRSYPNEVFRGKLAFVYPHVDEETRTIAARLEVDNPEHKLRPGSTATVRLAVAPKRLEMFNTAAMDEKAAAMLEDGRVLAVPESAVIDTGSQKIVYRQAEPGVFEGLQVELGPRMTREDGVTFFPVLSGVEPEELVVTAGSFLVDAETRLNPAAGSIYFGGSSGASGSQTAAKVRPSTPHDADAKIRTSLARLSAADRKLAAAQKYCPVLKGSRLGSMGTPVKLTIAGETVFLCCAGCKDKALGAAEKTVARAAELRRGTQANAKVSREPKASAGETRASDDAEAEIAAEMAKLSPEDRKAAIAQRFCAVETENRLGTMGIPQKVTVAGKTVFLCCEGCREQALANPQKTLKNAKQK